MHRWAWIPLKLIPALTVLGVFLAALCIAQPTLAHPHVWVTVQTVVLIDAQKRVTGVRHLWSFDELYSSFVMQGVEKTGDNPPSRDDLAVMARENVEALKEFAYFTYPSAAGKKLAVHEPTDYFLEYKKGVLYLGFTLPLAAPVETTKTAFDFMVYDPTYYIALSFADTNPVTLSESAPKECRIGGKVPQPPASEAPKSGSDAAKTADALNRAFSDALGSGASGTDLSMDTANGPIVVSCMGDG